MFLRFVGGHPRNEPMLEDSFLRVEYNTGGDDWLTVYTDAHWETK